MNPETFAAYKVAQTSGDSARARVLMGMLIASEEAFLRGKARRVAQGDYDLDDLVQAGRLALMRVIEVYDPARGNFARIAVIKIKDAFNLVIANRAQVRAGPKWGVSSTCRGLCQMPTSVRRAEQAFVARHGRPPTAEDLGVDADDLAAWRSSAKMVSYDENPEKDDGEDRWDDTAVVHAAVHDVHHSLSKTVRRAIGGMTQQEQRILRARVIVGLEFTEIAESEGLGRNVISRIYDRCIQRLREALTGTTVRKTK